ncbi:bifunctional phosphopantothenoylcysteine decarboxylase/phosphopantothenate--cysteine ligase CoaBC [Verrucomicrobiota bacterium]
MKILITAGPTREPIDPVRFISNRSSGKMGYAVANAAIESGHEVVLVSGPVSLPVPAGAVFIKVTTAEEMYQAVQDQIDWYDVLIMTAAVADRRPAKASKNKIKKDRMESFIELTPTADILYAVRDQKKDRLHIGFAAETDNIIEEARRKLVKKRLDLIVANDVTRPDSGFETDTNKVTFITRSGLPLELPVMSKHEVAVNILEWIEENA